MLLFFPLSMFLQRDINPMSNAESRFVRISRVIRFLEGTSITDFFTASSLYFKPSVFLWWNRSVSGTENVHYLWGHFQQFNTRFTGFLCVDWYDFIKYNISFFRTSIASLFLIPISGVRLICPSVSFQWMPLWKLKR